MDGTALAAALRYFPLTGRPRPLCPPLPDRVREISDIAQAAAKPAADILAEAPHALNKAALLASDCGLPELSRNLCWVHINIYRQRGQLTIPLARQMLEPVLNLARLAIRAQAPDTAVRLLDDIHQAVAAGADLVIDGHTLPLANLTGTRDQYRKLREWVWLQYLSDGIRAHTLVGRWHEAVAHAEALRGIGAHLLEGRQAAIISRILSGEHQKARRLVDDTTITEPWEHHIAACLTLMTADGPLTRDLTTTIAQEFLREQPVSGYVVFRARLGLAAASLTSDTDPATAETLISAITTEAIRPGDGYAAREILRHPFVRESRHHGDLTRVVATCGLGAGALPTAMLDSLNESVATARTMLAARLSVRC
ncbi:hypothetical protein [Frankia sp. Cr1]|uniref:hypothetical protein n=1 Tax=Frankia sp. Cr1 TaxID=3073931 RepID=UPI002AD4C697|nr:hypothetical protein [Frankia sp. Cr1]